MGAKAKTDLERLKDAEDILRAKNARIALLERELREVKRHNDTVEETRKVIYQIKEAPMNVPDWTVRLTAPKSSGIPIAPLGDIHWGQQIAAEQTGGMNTFNRAIAKIRLRRWTANVIDLCYNHMTHPHYPGIIVPLMGDIISGNIHEELRETNEGPVMVSVMEAQSEIARALTVLADHFKRVFVPCVVGNHGRNSIKPRFINRTHENYEWGIYMNLREYFKNDARFTFLIPDEPDAFFSVYGHRFMQTHGDTLGVKGGDGMIGALGPIARGNLKIGRAEKEIGRDFDTLLIGHWHAHQPAGAMLPVIVNGCVCGYDTYARLQLRVPFSRPTQMLVFVHPKYGLTAQWAVFLEGKRKFAPAEEWVRWNDRRAKS
jgi:predicted phosphodiesterase